MNVCESRGMIASRHCIPLKHLRAVLRLGQLSRYVAKNKLLNMPPKKLDGGDVLQFALIDAQTPSIGNTVHRVTGKLVGSIAGLAICRLGKNGYYLFYCDPDWNVITDTFHESVEDAMRQAAFEFDGIAAKWQTTKSY